MVTNAEAISADTAGKLLRRAAEAAGPSAVLSAGFSTAGLRSSCDKKKRPDSASLSVDIGPGSNGWPSSRDQLYQKHYNG